jgi:hypothetical protein
MYEAIIFFWAKTFCCKDWRYPIEGGYLPVVLVSNKPMSSSAPVVDRWIERQTALLALERDAEIDGASGWD